MFFRKKKSKDNLQPQNIPKHLAIIMDGNGRWAKRRGLPRMAGHRAGSDRLRDVCKDCIHFGIKYLTVYAFSTENWRRPDEEVNALMKLVTEFFVKYEEEMAEQGIRLRFMGDLSALPADTLATIKHAEEVSSKRNNLQLIVAINYGGRDELKNAFIKLAKDIDQTKVNLQNITIDTIQDYLYLPDLSEPDLLIRPGGEKRLSNFLLWQTAYTELWFSDVLWPDFSRDDLRLALLAYSDRDRRFGGVKS